MFVIYQKWHGVFRRYWQGRDSTGDLFVYPIHKESAQRFATKEEAEDEAQYIPGAEVEELEAH